MNGRGITAAEVNAGQCLDPYRQIELLRAEVAAIGQRVETAERLADVRADALLRTLARAEKAESDLAAELALKATAYAKLDSVRTVVEETIIPALEAVRLEADNARVYLAQGTPSAVSGPLVRADSAATDALAAARKTLED